MTPREKAVREAFEAATGYTWIEGREEGQEPQAAARRLFDAGAEWSAAHPEPSYESARRVLTPDSDREAAREAWERYQGLTHPDDPEALRHAHAFGFDAGVRHAEGENERLRSALRAIRGPEDRGHWIEEHYRPAGGGYGGLQAIARAALSRPAAVSRGKRDARSL